MFAVHADKFSSDDPLSGLVVGERPDPVAPEGWATVTVKAASLNHHDLWSLRGVGLREDALPMILGCDAAGYDEDGNEVVVHAVISDPDWRGDETFDPKRSLLSERFQGTFADRVVVPRRNLVPKPAVADVRGGRLPADRVAHGVPDAVHAGRPQGRRHRAGPGRRRRRRDRADHAGPRRGPAGAGDQPGRGQACPGAGDRRARGLRVRCAAAGQGRRGDGDRRPGHLVALDPVACAPAAPS